MPCDASGVWCACARARVCVFDGERERGGGVYLVRKQICHFFLDDS